MCDMELIYAISSPPMGYPNAMATGPLRRLDTDTGNAHYEGGKQKYQSIVGSQQNWLMLSTRPDIAFTVSMLSKFLSAPSSEHLAAATYTLRYLRNTSNLDDTKRPTETFRIW